MNRLKLALAALALLLAPLARASIVCSGSVSYLAVNSASVVYTQLSGFGVWAVCNLATPYSNGGNTVSVESCRAWYAALLAQKKADGSAVLYFTSAVNAYNGPDCVALGTWVAPSPLPYHIEFP
jgi:hypothetical protein